MQGFQEKPILLINEQFEINQEGMDFIKSLSDKKISIISVIGPKSSGKSFLSNQLIGKFNNGFEIGSIENRTECCTRGIYIWGRPIINNEIYTLILDTQGFQIENEDQIKFNQKIFILINLISSNVIYNYKKDDENDDSNNISEQVIKNSFELFMKLLPILNNVKLDKNNNDLSQENIPNYFWVYRDYLVNDFSKYNDILNSLSPGDEYYNNLFKSRIRYFSLPPPMEENDMLINLYLDEEDDGKGGPFDDEYKKKLEEFKKQIFNDNKPKMLSGNILNGSLLESLLNDYIKSLSLNKTLFVNEPLIRIINTQLEKMKNKAIESLIYDLNKKNGNIIDFVMKFQNSYEILSDTAFNIFGETKIENKYIIENIKNIINLFGKELIEKYFNNNISKYNDIIKNLINKNENTSILKSNKINQKYDIKLFYTNFINEIKEDMENSIFNSKYEFLTCFPLIKNYFDKCIFNHISSYIDKIDNYLDITIKEQKASEELSKILEEKNNEIYNQKTQIKEMGFEINELKKKLEAKEKEYEENLKTKNEEYQKLELEKKAITEEKNNLIKELEDKNDNLESEKKELLGKVENLEKNLEDMNNKNKELDAKINEFIEKEKRKPKPQMVNIKEEDLPKLVELFNEIQTTTKEYNEAIKLFTKNKSKILYTKFMEESKNSLNDSCQGWVDELKKITKEKTQSKDSIYNEEINNLKEDKIKLNEELSNIKNEMIEIRNKNEKLEEQLKLTKDIQNDIEIYKKDYESTINLLKSNNEENEKKLNEMSSIKSKMNELEINLSTFKVESKMKEEELNSTLNAFKSMIEKKKSIFDSCLKKLPENIKNEVIAINRKYKFLK